MVRRTLFALTVLIVFAALPALVKADTITFEDDTTGLKLTGFQSVQSSIVTFRDTSGNRLLLDNLVHQSIGKGLGIISLPSSAFILDFSVDVNFLSLDFGNDDPAGMLPGATAVLEVFHNGTMVGTSEVLVNLNDVMDQTIVFSMANVVFNRAIFRYHQPVGVAASAEVIDNITFTPASAPVPEPASILLLSTAVATLAIPRLRRRRRTGRVPDVRRQT